MGKGFRRAIGLVIAGIISLSSITGVVENTKVVQGASQEEVKLVKLINAMLGHFNNSLKRNYLGLKNVSQWQSYEKQIGSLIERVPYGSMRDGFETRLNTCSSLLRAAEMVNHVEKSITPKWYGGYGNHLGIKNAETWNSYLSNGLSLLGNVQGGFSPQVEGLNRRLSEAKVVVDGIITKHNSDLVNANRLYLVAEKSLSLTDAQAALRAAEALGTHRTSDELEAKCRVLIAKIGVGVKVTSVRAINPKEIEVKFSEAVDISTGRDTNYYSLNINGVNYDTKYQLDSILSSYPNNIGLSSDGTTAILRLRDGYIPGRNVFINGDRFSLNIKDGIYSRDRSKKVVAYTGVVNAFSDTTSPRLIKSEVTTGNKLKVTFDEPVSNGVEVAVNGVMVTMGAPSSTIGDYSVESVGILPEGLRSPGKHLLLVTSVYDLALPYSNRATSLIGEYTVAPDMTIPVVTSIRAVSGSDRSFDIIFSEPLKYFDPSKLIIKKGIYSFPQSLYGEVNNGWTTYSLGYAALNNDWSTGSVGSFLAGTTRVVRVTFGADGGVIPLYSPTEGTAGLTIDVEGFRDMADNLGYRYIGGMSLVKSGEGPKVLGINNNAITGGIQSGDGKLTVKFDRALQSTVDRSLITVTDKNNNIRVVNTANVGLLSNNNTVELALTGIINKSELDDLAPFTISFGAGGVRGSDGIGNKQIVTSIISTVPESVEAVNGLIVNKNIITVQYKTQMSYTAGVLSNYTLDGGAFPSGTTIYMNPSSTEVTITLPEGYTNTPVNRVLSISKNVTTILGKILVGNLATKQPYANSITIEDNAKPYIVEGKYLVNNLSTDLSSSKIKLTFSEGIAGITDMVSAINDLKLTVDGGNINISSIEDTIPGDSTITLILTTPITIGGTSIIAILEEGVNNPLLEIKDLKGNKSKPGIVQISLKELTSEAIASGNLAQAAIEAIQPPNARVIDNFTLPLVSNTQAITWSSNNPAIGITTQAGELGGLATVTRPESSGSDAVVTLTASITVNGQTRTKNFTVTVSKKEA
ncbi:MAG: hypothetical protein RR838_12205 [Clostridium sp.]